MNDSALPRLERPPGRHEVVWHPTYADFAAYYGFRPWAHWPYRPQTKGKTESGVKYVLSTAVQKWTESATKNWTRQAVGCTPRWLSGGAARPA